MKLKYYLRGIGIGVIVTTIIFMISISIHKNDKEQQEMVVEDTEAKTVSENLVSDTQIVDKEKEEKKEPQKTVDEVVKSEETKPLKEEVKKEEIKKEETEENQEKIRFQISGGEFSDVVCRKLEEEKLVDDALAFNKFLVEHNYDNFILPGVYDIPRGATYEEIAVLLTTKVE